MEVNRCSDANWWGSFDYQGWSFCPQNTYIQGFWKNNCEWIYCLEMGIAFFAKRALFCYEMCDGRPYVNVSLCAVYVYTCSYVPCVLYTAKCCRIHSSRGRTECGGRDWWASFDVAGFSFLDRDFFMVGLFRSGGQQLFNIESPFQCRYFANPKHSDLVIVMYYGGGVVCVI